MSLGMFFFVLFGLVGLLLWWNFKDAGERSKPHEGEAQLKKEGETPKTTATPTTPPPAYPAVSAKKKHGFFYWIVAILVWVVIIGGVCVAGIFLKHWATGGPIDWSWSGPTLPPPPDLNCDGWVDLDAKHAEDHSKDDVNKPVYIKTVPVGGSKQKPCWSTWVVLPPYKVEWHVKFLNKDLVKDHCVAYVKYEGVARVWGPYIGTVDIGENNMPANNGFRLATNCKVYVYGE